MTDDWIRIGETVAIENPEYELALEEYRRGADQMVFIHLWVKKDWSLALLKRFKHEFSVLRQHVTCPLYACSEADDDKWSKFVTLFGFKPLSEALCTDGVTRRIYWHQGNDLLKTTNANTVHAGTLVSSAAVPDDSLQRRADGAQPSQR
jgi:hypothetical protein